MVPAAFRERRMAKEGQLQLLMDRRISSCLTLHYWRQVHVVIRKLPALVICIINSSGRCFKFYSPPPSEQWKMDETNDQTVGTGIKGQKI